MEKDKCPWCKPGEDVCPRHPLTGNEEVTLDVMRSVYIKEMGTAGLNLADTTARFITRVWDGMDGCWCDCTGEVNAEEALRNWWSNTEGGTRNTSFNDIDYYCIFPANTTMKYSGRNEMFR